MPGLDLGGTGGSHDMGGRPEETAAVRAALCAASPLASLGLPQNRFEKGRERKV